MKVSRAAARAILGPTRSCFWFAATLKRGWEAGHRVRPCQAPVPMEYRVKEREF